jgi:hypothetical protein
MIIIGLLHIFLYGEIIIIANVRLIEVPNEVRDEMLAEPINYINYI